jgi:peptidylprolyl isomerase
MKALLLAAAAALAAPSLAADTPGLSPGEIVTTAPASDWRAISSDDLLVMDLAPDSAGKARRVIIQLMPAPFSQPWVANVRTLAKAHWWDGLAIVRAQDNYVVQWGDPDGEDASKARALPEGLSATREEDYVSALPQSPGQDDAEGATKAPGVGIAGLRDSYAPTAGFTLTGWPVASDGKSWWPVHCYASVGVGRNLSPDAGTGAELYTVIGHAPRHLDRNIAVVGRVIAGMEHLSTLPRGTGDLGFYQTPEERTPIAAIRLAGELPQAERPRFEYLSTESKAFAAYAQARASRRDAFFIVPAGGADVCNVPVPVRRAP